MEKFRANRNLTKKADTQQIRSIFHTRRKTGDNINPQKHRYVDLWSKRHSEVSKRLQEIDDRISVIESKEQSEQLMLDTEA